MRFYAQRIDTSRLLHIEDVRELCTKSGIVVDALLDTLLKMWLAIEYVHERDFWRRRFYVASPEYVHGGKQVKGNLIVTYAPAYVYFPETTEDNEFPVDIIALDKKSFDGAMELLRQSGEAITTKSLSFH